jgi:PAS domain S-box-containing protein
LIYTTYIDKDDNLWFSTYGCLSKYDGKNFSNYYFDETLRTDRIESILQDHTGQVWVGTFGGGFGVFKNGVFKFIDSTEGLSNNYINDMIEDREGNFWIATNNGLNKFSGDKFVNYTTDEGLTNINILSVYISPKNKIWIGTNAGGLNVLTENSFTVFNNPMLPQNSSIWSILQDRNDNMWFGTTNGLVRYDEKRKSFSKPYPQLNTQLVYSMCEGKSGELYCGTDKGLVILNDTEVVKIGYAQGMQNEKVRSVYQDANGILWIGTLKGIYYLRNNKIYNFSKTYNIPVAPITSIIEDGNHNLLFSTYAFGLLKVSGTVDAPQILLIDNKKGLTNNTLLFCFLDKAGFLWLGSINGVDKLNWNEYLKSNKFEIEHFNKSNGYLGAESNNAAMDTAGNVWFATINGLIKHNRNSLKVIAVKPIISISNVQLFLSDVNWANRFDSLDKITGLPERLILNYNENHISFTYQGVYLTAPDELQYSYMLKGFDKKWLPPTAHNEAYYPNLSAGEYVFKVRATVNGIDWSEPTVFFFKVTPPWWKTIWAYLFYFFGGSGLLYGLLFLRTRSLESSRNALSQKVIERTRDLNAINLELSKISLVASETDNAVLIFDKDLELTYANAGFSKMTGYSIDELIKKRGSSIKKITFNENINQVLEIAINEKRSQFYESQMTTKDGKMFWSSTTLTPIFSPNGNLKNIVVIDTDITEIKNIEKQLKDSLNERGLLLKEIHHRVKNNLQIIISLFNLQSNYITDENALKALKEGQNRIKSMALIHERFYQSEGLSKIDFDGYIKRLAENLFMSYNINHENVKLIIDADKVALDIDTAVPCGLIINELISNALKYAFDVGAVGEVYIGFKSLDDDLCQLTIGDNGKGLVEGYDVENSDTLGMQLVHALTDQLEGKLSVLNKNGLHFTVVFKKHIEK